MASSFKGLPAGLFSFLRDLKNNNNREWFHENKQRYTEQVVTPMCEFIEAMSPRLWKLADCFVADPRPHGGSMFRIYKDTRFSNDKRPYKEHIACHFRHEAGKDAHAPGFYVHIETGKVMFGGGIWMPPTPVLNQVRDAIVENPDAWSAVVKNRSLNSRTSGIEGDGLKRAPRGFDEQHPHINDIKRKTWFAMTEGKIAVAKTADFIKEVDKTFKAISPMMAFITESLGLCYQRH